MTEMELLTLIGEADDAYVLASCRRPRKKTPIPWANLGKAVAACLAVAVVGTAGYRMLRSGGFSAQSTAGSSAAAEAVMEDASAEEALLENGAPAEEPAAAEGAYPGDTADLEAGYGVAPLALAAYPEAVGVEDWDALSAVWTLNQTSDETKAALNAFAYRTASAVLRGGTASGAYSPLSLYQALAVLASGAEGETKSQLLSLLGQTEDTLAEQTGKLYRVNYKNNEQDVLQIANSLWLDETDAAGEPVGYHQDWVMAAARDYYADVYAAEFGDEDTALALGSWIARKTGGLLHPAPETLGFDQNTVMAIVNTLWYSAQWQEEFDQGRTASGDFTREDGQTVTVDFMHGEDALGSYIDTERYTKSYRNLTTGKMIVVLPKEGVSVDELLTEEALWEVFENGGYSSAQVNWSVPKFQTDATYELKEALQSLGVADAFNSGAADFSPMADAPLFVGKIQQGTHIAFDEEGVEAAAYTAIGMELAGAPGEEPTIIDMNLNRPFIYLITSDDGSTLFLGVVRDPLG